MINTILATLQNAKHVVLVSHRSPDGDTLGANLALAHYLESIGVRSTSYCVDEPATPLQFLPKAYEVGHHESVWNDPSVDVVVILDTSDPHHAGVTEHVLNPEKKFTTIVIDHHATNELYGDLNLVEADASSACELVYRLLSAANAITAPIATCLLTGIITDTGSFSNLATTASSIHSASDLLSRGANLQTISKHALHYRPYATLKLWGRALERLYEDKDTGMIVTAVTKEDLEECEVDDSAISGISNFLNTLDETAEKAVMVLAEIEPGVIKASLRTTSPLIDVSEFAKLHGGGGHRKAAGFTINGTLAYTTNGYEIIPTSN